MVTGILYVLSLIVIGSLIWLFFSLTLGRGDSLPPIHRGYSLVTLPSDGAITREDIDNVTFRVNFRGYNQLEVDWVLDKLADRIDQLEAKVGEGRGSTK